MPLLATIVLLLAVGVAIATATALIVSILWPLVRRTVAGWHPVDRGRLALTMAVAPVLVPCLLLAALLAPGIGGLVAPGLDHCTAHPEHPHLCLVHPSAALSPKLAWIPLAIVGASATVLARSLRRRRKATRELRMLRLAGCRELDENVDVVDVERPFAVTFGLLHPRTLLSAGLLHGLEPGQLASILAHEREHARRRDPLQGLLARLASVPLWPAVRRELLSVLALSAEQACDERAALASGDRLAFAETILAVERLLARNRSGAEAAGIGIGDGSLRARVAALMAEPARQVPWKWRCATTALGLLLVAAARPLHHEVEHLLSLMLGSR